MRKRHVFRPTGLDLLEDRTVPSHLLAAGPSVAIVRSSPPFPRGHQTRGVVPAVITNQISLAFASFDNDVRQAIAATDFTPPPVSFPPVPFPPFFPPPFFPSSNPNVESLRSAVLQRVGLLDQQVGTILAAVPGASRRLLPQVQNQILGLGPSSLAVGLAAVLNPTSFSSATVPNAASTSAQAQNLIATARLATINDLAIFAPASASDSGPRRPAARSSPTEALRLAQVPNLITQEFASFTGDFQSAFVTFGLSGIPFFGPGPPPPPSDAALGAFKAAATQRLGLLSLDVGNILARVPGATRIVPFVRRQIVGPDPGSLLQTITSTLNTIATSSSPGPSSATDVMSRTAGLTIANQVIIISYFNLFINNR